MMIKKISLFFAATICMAPMTAFAEGFDSVDDCRALRNEVSAAIEKSSELDTLLDTPNISLESYLEQLYSGVKILSQTGEAFFKAADNHESACKTSLRQANKIEEIRVIYEWYLEPSQKAYQFFHRAREVAVQLNRQSDVDTFNEIMNEYDAAIMKIADVCKSDLENTPSLPYCSQLAAKLADTLK